MVITMSWIVTYLLATHALTLVLSRELATGGGNEMLSPGCGAEDTPVYLEKCIRLGAQLLQEYVKRLAKGRLVDTCRHYDEFKKCIKCPYVSGWLHNDWLPVIRQLNCACQEDGGCRAELDCFEMEYKTDMVKRCDHVYKFNLQQKTKGRCFFVQDNLNCKVALVTSRCGKAAGTFAYHVNSILAHAQSNNQQCSISQPKSFKGYFVYDPNCPTIFMRDMATCSYQHLWGVQQHLSFHHDNDLVAEGERGDVKNACSSYREYKLCMRPIKKACRAGTDIIYSYDSHLRKYVLKMEYICKKSHKEVYANHLTCYQDVLYNQSLEQCAYIWKALAPWLDKVSSHDFYCSRSSPKAAKLKEELANLRTCYEETFRSRCGSSAGELMGELIAIAFQDPHYLRFDYKPDCRLHGGKARKKHETPDPTTTTTTTAFISQTISLQSTPDNFLPLHTSASVSHRRGCVATTFHNAILVSILWILLRFRWR